MEITNAKYQLNFNGEVYAVNCTLNGHPSTVIPMDESNSDWIIIKAKIDDKSLTVAAADPLVTEEE